MVLGRRAFITSLGCALTSRQIVAKQATTARTVGVLMGLEKDDSEAHARARAFERGLRGEGWSVRENLRIEYRFSGGDFGRMQAFVTELVTLKPDCIVGHTTPIVKALMRATETIPIVFVAVTDPIGSNIVASRGRPGGNTTGFAIVQATMAGKYLSILRELMPQLSCVAIVYHPDQSSAATYFLQPFIDVAREYNIEAIVMQFATRPRLKTASHNSPANPPALLLSCRTISPRSIVSCISRPQRATAFPQFIPFGISPRQGAYYPMG